jgi:Glycosyl hydrolases family 28
MKAIPTAVLLLCSIGLALTGRAGTTEPLFQVRVNGQPLDLHEFLQGAFGQFELAQPVEIEIRAAFDVRWVEVRPKSAGIAPVIGSDHQTVRIQLKSARPVAVEFNDDLAQVLHLFAYPPEKDPPQPGAPNVRYFGPGIHEAGLIELKDGETLYLAPGSWVKGNVRSIGTKNVVIRGRGILDGSEVGRQAARKSSSANGTAAVPAYAAGDDNMIYLQGTTGATVEGITIFNSSHWTLYARSTRGTHIDGVRILNSSVNYGNDGIDLVSSSDVLVENVFVRTNDDCVVVKNLDDVETRNILVRRAVLWNMPTGGNALEIGFEMRNRTASNIRFEDIDIIHVERGAAISIHNGDAATVEDVMFDDIRVEDVRRKLVDFAVLYAQYGADRAPTQEERERRMDRGGVWDGAQRFTTAERPERAKFRGHVRNITVRNLNVVAGTLPYSLVAGFDGDHAVENVVIEGLQYQGRLIRTAAEGKFVLDHAPGFTIR